MWPIWRLVYSCSRHAENVWHVLFFSTCVPW